jgi:hypothetical protein
MTSSLLLFVRAATSLLVAAAAGSALVACSDDHADDDHSHGDLPASCQSIVDACHTKVVGPGELDDCHELAHHGDDADCKAAISDGCVEKCEAAPDADADAMGHGDEDSGAGGASP